MANEPRKQIVRTFLNDEIATADKDVAERSEMLKRLKDEFQVATTRLSVLRQAYRELFDDGK